MAAMRNRFAIFSLLLSVLSICHEGSAEENFSEASIQNIPSNLTEIVRHLRTTKKEKEVAIEGQLPEIFIIGAQKGGSMSLLDLMTQHPLLCRGTHREPHFFSIDENFKEGSKFYTDLFADAKCNKNAKTSKYIDGTPMLHISKVWDRIVQTYGKDMKKKDNLKFIVLLREPVSRDFVWYQHVVRNDLHRGQKFTGIKTLSEMNLESNFTSRNGEDTRYGRYIDHIKEFLHYFRRDQLLVLSSQAVFDDASSIMKKIYKFIDVPEEKVVQQVVLPRTNHFIETGTAFETCAIHHIPEMDCFYRDQMGKYYEPYNQKLYAWIKESKNLADENEPKFGPPFESYTLAPCVKNARRDFDSFLSKEGETIAMREEFQTKTNSFGLPVGACHNPNAAMLASQAND